MRIASYLFVVLFVVFAAGCTEEPPTIADATQAVVGSADGLAGVVASEALALTTWECVEPVTAGPAPLAKGGSSPRIMDYDRFPLGGGIVHYRFQIRVGPGNRDIIGLHRVVKEVGPGRPAKVRDAIFLQHGDVWGFETVFLPYLQSTELPDRFGLAAYLAERDVDVWGIDQPWTLVPAGTTDFTFMKDWGIQRNVDDLRTAIAIARILRLATGFGNDKMILLGYSSGGVTGFATLNHETQVPQHDRQVRGFIAADAIFKSDDPAIHRVVDYDRSVYEPGYSAGVYQAPIVFAQVGTLARTDPGGDSPIVPGLTNLQVSLFFGCGQVYAPDVSIHYLAGYMDATGFPTGVRLLTLTHWLGLLERGVPFEAARFFLDVDAVQGDFGDPPFDDHLGEIRVPVLNLGAAGGFGPYTRYGTTLLGSHDITNKIVGIGTGDVLTEFAHVDMFQAPQAQTLVWQPLLQWLQAHRK